MNIINKFAMLAGVALLAAGTSAQAQVGEPTGSFGIKITQGATTIVNNPNVIVPADIKISDGDAEDFVQIGTIGAGGTPIILKIVTDDDPNFRISHWYIDVPASLNDIYSPGPTSLFDPNNPHPIEVEITGLAFTATTNVTPLIVNNATYAAAFMRDLGGRFYNLPDSVATGFPGPATTVQVYGEKFFDGNVSQYTFAGSNFLPTASWKWSMLPNPGALTTVNDQTNPSVPNLGGGYVFELGLGVSFVGVPEPGTIGMMIPGLLAVIARKRRR
jgi:hypothetical protein